MMEGNGLITLVSLHYTHAFTGSSPLYAAICHASYDLKGGENT